MYGLFLAGYAFSVLAKINAYLDPGSGSFLLQMLLAALLGGAFVLKTYWTKIKEGVDNLFARQQEEEDNERE